MVWSLFIRNLGAQTGITGYLDLGSSNVSQGLILNGAFSGQVQFGKNRLEAGLQMDLKLNSDQRFSGYRISATRGLQVKDLPFQVEGFLLWTPYAQLLLETNWGFLLKLDHKHFSMKLGTEFRNIAFTSRAVDVRAYEQGERIRENWNLAYFIEYRVKPPEAIWNMGFALTNLDYFLINQETNPLFRARVEYQVVRQWNLFAEAWYKSAGAFNLSVNYFGFIIRTGVVWEIQ